MTMTDTRWTYKVIDLKGSFFAATVASAQIEEALNRLGMQGWELVAADTAQKPFQPIRAILKRPL
ncbi:MAG: hypothetical protein COW59_13255 [Lysobacterales bacterium CG17_big_fil_post_rev_8_21_14_2_50_64_11]|nr:MAG: hypothetical protein COW59_13255 [Xanthomonadales bacterium CG17_big_fil_post_rev_8_21_14_2_50_64_11]PIX60948.1 MAG: DUF4177 domain-containing protein [Xanthomonadales bacterium CG_4_10_14_3_um_filter_64_11]